MIVDQKARDPYAISKTFAACLRANARVVGNHQMPGNSYLATNHIMMSDFSTS